MFNKTLSLQPSISQFQYTNVFTMQGKNENPSIKVDDMNKKSSSVIAHPAFSFVAVLLAFISLALRATNIQNLNILSGDFIEIHWNKLLDLIGDDEADIWLMVTPLVLFGTYWIGGTVYTLMDVTNKPAFLRKYKTQPGAHEPLDMHTLKKTLKLVLFNQLIVSGPVTYGAVILILGRAPPPRELPSLFKLVTDFALLLFMYEISFYYTHRLMHSRLFYKYIHKKHHEWTAPISIAAVYCHPVEHIVCNLLPLVMGVAILATHVFTAWLWFIYNVSITLNDHSGYHFPFFKSPQAHDFHHAKFNQFYGPYGVLDYLHGTDKEFRKSKNFQNHRVLLSLAPATR